MDRGVPAYLLHYINLFNDGPEHQKEHTGRLSDILGKHSVVKDDLLVTSMRV